MEEDAGKSLHEGFADSGLKTYLDFNRSGVPLVEIVTEPDMRSAEEAAVFFETLRQILVWLDVNDGNMDEGSLRCDANVSVRREGDTTLGTKTEVKNVNSFRYLEKAILFEIGRHIDVIGHGGRIIQETRLFDAAQGKTYSMRSKEEAHDYRYFHDPDLVPLRMPTAMVDAIRTTLPDLPEALRTRFVREFGLTEQTATVLTAHPVVAKYFLASVTAACASGAVPSDVSRDLANWIIGDLPGLSKEFWTVIPAAEIGSLSALKHRGAISGPIVKRVLEERLKTGQSVAEIIQAKGLTQVSDEGALDTIIDEVMAKNPSQVAQYRSGKEAVFGFFVGQVMKSSGGKANPATVNALLKRKLAA